MSAVPIQQLKRNRLTLLALIGIFALPPLLGWLFITNPQWLPNESINKGTLINPPRPLTNLTLVQPDGGQFEWEQLQNKWVFAVVNSGSCEAACIDRLITIRQIRKALAAESRRVERILILLPGPDGAAPGLPQSEGLEGTLFLTPADKNIANRITDLFQLEQVAEERQMFTIDPHSDLMMRHDLTTLKPKEILKDLELLLKASANWVTGEK